MTFLLRVTSMVVVVFFLLSTSVHANEYSVSPLIIDHDVAPRDGLEETIRVSNTTDHPLRLFPTVNEITVGSEGTVEKFIPASMGDATKSVTSWIEVSRAQLEIAVGDTVKVPVTIHINPYAAPGEYRAFIGFPEGGNRDEAEAKVLAGTAPGTIVRLSLAEKRSEYLRLEHFAVDRFITGSGEAHVTFDLENVGGMPLAPSGEIIFYDSTGNERASIKINEEHVTVEPGKTQSFSLVMPDLGTIGRYKAFLNVEYGTLVRANLYDTVFFNLVPIKLLLGVFGSLLLVSVIGTLLYHRRSLRHRHDEDDEQVAVYVRNGMTGPEKDHDINLKQ